MAKSISVHQKKRGRPATGRDPAITVRLPIALISAIDRWGARNSFSRSEAIRKLLEQTPALSRDKAPSNERKARKTAELAGRAVETMGSQSVPAEEQARRKRALIRGTKEFREIREDLPKPKKGSP
jgi:Arc/MetJ-type ribon-helix-helix transcriptional regulator